MLWFIIAILGYALLAIVMILDKFIVSKSVSKPVVYTFYSTIIMFGALFAWPIIGFDLLHGTFDWSIALLSGLGFGFGMWALYIAVKKGEATHINPFGGAFVTIGSYVFASLFLGESLNLLQQFGIIVLIAASILLSAEKSKKHHGFHSGFVWAAISGLCFAVSHTTSKYLYDIYPFWTAFIWTRAFVGVVGIITLFSPAVWKTFQKKNKKPAKSYAKRNAVSLMLSNKLLGVVSVVFIQYAIAIGSVTMVNALAGVQFVLMFVFVYLLTTFTPKLFKEYFTKREIRIQIIALLLVLVGSFLFVI